MTTNPLSVTRWRRRAAVLAAAAVTLALAAAPATARPVPENGTDTLARPGPAAAGRAATTSPGIAPNCFADFNWASGESLYDLRFRQDVVLFDRIGSFSFGPPAEPPQPPRTMTWVWRYNDRDQYLAIPRDGSLWQVVVDRSDPTRAKLSKKRLAERGWSGVRQIVGTLNLNHFYALTTSGGLDRYSVTEAGVVRRLGAVATSGWSDVRFLAPIDWFNPEVDQYLGLTASGGLSRYVITIGGGLSRTVPLQTSGWGKFSRIVTGRCDRDHELGLAILGATPGGRIFAHYDPDGFDDRGDDISPAGQVGRGFTGLISR
ncbi:MAG: hypothetical protein ACRCYR_13170 [Phycicoccus sp.]